MFYNYTKCRRLARTGSKNVLHLHGELLKVRSINQIHSRLERRLSFGDLDNQQNQLHTYCLV
jgi:NAD-dependent deacetylase